MEVHKGESHNDKRFSKHEKSNKHVKMSKDVKEPKHDRSFSNNRPGANKEKHKQSETSGPITAKTSKLPDAFLDVNYKGKRSMKSINKLDKGLHDNKYQKDSSISYPQIQPNQSSHGQSKTKQNKENSTNSPRGLENDDEHKMATDDEYRQGGKNKPKIITGKLPSAFSNPQIKYKSSKNEQYTKNIKDVVRIEDSYKNIQNSLDPLPMAAERASKINGHEKHKDLMKGYPSSSNELL